MWHYMKCKMFLVYLDFYLFHSSHNFKRQEIKLFRRVGLHNVSIKFRTKKSTEGVTKRRKSSTVGEPKSLRLKMWYDTPRNHIWQIMKDAQLPSGLTTFLLCRQTLQQGKVCCTGWPIWLVTTSCWLSSDRSGGLLAATVATFCPGRLTEHSKS